MTSAARNGRPRPVSAGRGAAVRHQLARNPYGLTLAEVRAEIRRRFTRKGDGRR